MIRTGRDIYIYTQLYVSIYIKLVRICVYIHVCVRVCYMASQDNGELPSSLLQAWLSRQQCPLFGKSAYKNRSVVEQVFSTQRRSAD